MTEKATAKATKKKAEEEKIEVTAVAEEVKEEKKATKGKKAASKSKKKDSEEIVISAEQMGTNEDTKFVKYIEEGKVLRCNVYSAGRNDPKYGEFVSLYVEGRRIIIPKEEFCSNQDSVGLLSYIGRSVPFILTSVDEENKRFIASRVKAQAKIIQTEFMNADIDTVYTAKICGIMQFGVYVDVNGVEGILRNIDYSNTNVAVIDNLGIGDEIRVKMKRAYAGETKIEFKAETFVYNNDLDTTKIEVDTVVKARVVKVSEYCFFARVLPGIDARCKLPFNDEVSVGDQILIRILENSVNEEQKLELKGKYIRHIL